MSCGETDLVTVAGISVSGLLGNHALWQFALKCLGNRLVDVACTCNTHCLVNIRTT